LGPLVVVFLALGLSTALSFPFLSLFLTSAVHAGPHHQSLMMNDHPITTLIDS
jgi:SET family sugar efflux transporter-like MFS transporter